jgi:hypothetical protein
MKTERDYYIDTKTVLSSTDRWTKGAYARTATGEACQIVTDSHASCFCLQGALYIASGRYSSSRLEHLAGKKLGPTQYMNPIASFNDMDTTSYEDVIGLLDEAIAELDPQ